MKKNKAFTLIELIVVLVILAIVAAISIPIVLNVIGKTEDAARKRSVDGYAKAVELAISNYKMDYGYYPKKVSDLKVEYSGSNVKCNEQIINKNGSIYLSQCYVDSIKVKDSGNNDGWYYYGKIINDYVIGDIVNYNGMDFYVIDDSNASIDYVTLLKATPLTVNEVNTYGAGHVNMYVSSPSSYYQTAYNVSGYGGMAYYSSLSCGYDLSGNYSKQGCTTDYAQSEIKYVVDAWSNDKLNISDLAEDSLGYKTRLLTLEDLTNNLGIELNRSTPTAYQIVQTEDTPAWVIGENYSYWTMTTNADTTDNVWRVSEDGRVYSNNVDNSAVVRPVINLKKDAIY